MKTAKKSTPKPAPKPKPIPPSGDISVVLSKQLAGKPVLQLPVCKFHYMWDFARNKGMAYLDTINGTRVDIALHPIGISGQLDFMSDMPPTRYSVNAEPGNSIALIEVIIYRVILDIDTKTGAHTAAIMFNEDGSSIQATANFKDGGSRFEV